MLLVAPVQTGLRQPLPQGKSGFDLLKAGRSTIPAVTHVDYSARIQTVTREVNARLYDLLLRFEQTTGCGVLINTSFNVRGEPIVCTPDDAYRCFMNTEMDYLIIGNFVIERLAQPRAKVERRIAPQADKMRLHFKEDPKEWRKTALLGLIGPAAIFGILRYRRVVSNTGLL